MNIYYDVNCINNNDITVMEKFISLLNLNEITQKKLSSIKAVVFSVGETKQVKLIFSTNDKLNEYDLSHLVDSIIKTNQPIALDQLRIENLPGILNASQIYSYAIKLVSVLNNDINHSHYYIEMDHESTKFIVTNEKTHKLLRIEFDKISNILYNSSIISKPAVLEFVILKEKIQKIRENIAKKEEEFLPKDETPIIRDGFTLVKPKLQEEQSKIYFEGQIAEYEERKVKTKQGPKVIRSFVVGKEQDAVSAQHWGTETEGPTVKNGSYLRVYGSWKHDSYRNEYRISIGDIGSWQYLEQHHVENSETDDYPENRTELHVHTKMSYMDGVSNVGEYIEKARNIGLKAISINDHDSVQSYPEAANYLKSNNIEDLKLIYGVELSILDDVNNKIVWNSRDADILNSEYIFFDLETTGLSPKLNKLIEFGAVKYKDGVIVETKQMFINPKKPIPQHITEITNINDSDVKDAPDTLSALKEIKDWIGDSILVAHNAKFDFNFLDYNLKHYGFGPLKNTVIDTMGLARLIHPTLKSHTLGNVAKAEYVVYNEMAAHRADYDAIILQKTYENLIHKMLDQGIRNITDLEKKQKNIINYLFPNHINVLAKNQKGIKDIYKLISAAHTIFFAKQRERAVVPLSFLLENRENLLLGSSCSTGFVWNAINDSPDNIDEIFKYFDFIEVFPPSAYHNLVARNIFDEKQLQIIIESIIEKAKELDIPVVATSNAHYASKKDKIVRDIYIHNKGLKGRRHPLFNWKHKDAIAPDHHLRTSTELVNEFNKFLKEDYVYDIVIKNPNHISQIIDDGITPLKEGLFTPVLPEAEENFKKTIEETLKQQYGDNLDPIIEERIEREVKSITKHGYAIVYYLSSLTVNKSLEDGYLVGSRGSVGSSLAATMTNITEVNPLPPHYKCAHCKYHEFVNGYGSGYDLPSEKCPNCGQGMIGDGHNIPFETFLGFDGDKVPDIDLNFSREYQSEVHKFVKNLLGESNVFRAGTISTVANRTAFGYIKNYIEETNQEEDFTPAQIKFLAKRVEGVKRTTGQHPGGLIVVPSDMHIHDFTPINYPGNDTKSNWKTTHFDFHSIHDNLLKLDLLGHLDPSSIRMLQNLTNIDPKSIPMNDKEVLKLFESNEPLKYVENYTDNDLGILGVPEFGTIFVRKLVKESKPKTFADLIRLSGLSHGTDVWSGNARELILNEDKTLEEIISTRDDIMSYLISLGMDNLQAFNIMESVRKGKGLKLEWEKAMKEADVPDWYIASCKKIKYMFPKAHATAYVLMAFRIAWFKINYPLEYYATFFTKRDTEWDISSLKKGVTGIKNYIKEIKKLGWSASEKEKAIAETYEIVLEMYSRGYEISDISINESRSTSWVIDKELKKLIPPFLIVDGLGETAASLITKERHHRQYVSKDDFKARSGINQTLFRTFEELGILDTFEAEEETGQISLF